MSDEQPAEVPAEDPPADPAPAEAGKKLFLWFDTFLINFTHLKTPINRF